MKEAGKDSESVSLVELDRATSKNLARARQKPLLVTNRHTPWIWIVSHDVWMRDRQYLEYIPDTHPLMRLGDLLDLYMARQASGQAQWQANPPLRLPVQAACRALLLQLLYSIPDVRALYENIGYNMLFRRFVGADIRRPLWNWEEFESDLRTLAATPAFVVLADEVIALLASVEQRDRFCVDHALLQAWRTRAAAANCAVAPAASQAPSSAVQPYAPPGVLASRASAPLASAAGRRKAGGRH